ncbi:hypothetical protein [Erythrobacter sp. F6033]|uniref:hypothetical protein n=1 Tax=Erythrobacter sp. F6033 TaxID=2926401 RepID=UPI001FF147EC|nr:hypothetical protein [Erythrobacter sp. F6033]MCK0128623.1 hypothetical protein [Erythrobacter sp. F6033]
MSRVESDALSFLASEQVRLLQSGVGWLAAYVLIYLVGYSTLDLLLLESDGLYLVFSIVTWGLGFALMVKLMQHNGNLPNGIATGIGTYFGLSLIVGICVFLGALLFLLPGVYLALRLQAAYPHAAAKGGGVGDAMKWSWAETEAFQRPLIFTFIPPLMVYFTGIGLLLWYEYSYLGFSEFAYQALTITANLFLAVALAWFTLLCVAVYGLLSDRMSDVTQTFE